jgi:hypothetical protein
MKKIFLITLLSFFISSVSYSQNKDLLKLKCTYGKNEAVFFYELDIKKSKHKIIAHIHNEEVIRTNVNLFENKKFSIENFQGTNDSKLHLDEKIVSLEDETGKFDLARTHLIYFTKGNFSNVSIVDMTFVKGITKPTGMEHFKLSCIEINSFPNLILGEKEKNDNRKVFTLKNCYYTPQQKSFDKNRFDQLDVEVDRIKKKVNLKVILSDNELKKDKELSEKYKKNISVIYNIDSDKNNIIKASTIRNNEKEELIINVNKLEINQGKNRLICE